LPTDLAQSAGGEDVLRGIAQKIRDGFFQWIVSGLKVEREQDRKPLASLAFATIEGFVLLDALDSPHLIDSALKGLSRRRASRI